MADEIHPVDEFADEVQFIRTTDRVLGDPPGTAGKLSGPINVVIQKIINSLLWLKNRVDGIDTTVPNATTSQRGVIELATADEARAATDTVRAMTPANTKRFNQSTAAQASETDRGTAKVASKTDAIAGTNNIDMMTPKRTSEVLEDMDVVSSEDIDTLEKKTAATYKALQTKDDNTLYIIVG